MKVLSICMILVAQIALSFAQAPQQFSFQGVARRADGKEVGNTPVGVRISILKGSPVGVTVYQEAHSPSTNSKGIFDLSIGGGQVLSGDLNSLDWANGKYFLKFEIDVSGGTNYISTGISQLLSVPYSLHTQTARSWIHNEPIVQAGLFQGGGQLGPPGDGPRLIWYPRKAAFVAGYNTGAVWDGANLGEYSIGGGNQSVASGLASVAMGWQSEAKGIFSVAMGEKSMAVGDGSTALGLGAVAKAAGAVALGAFNNNQDSPAPNGAGALATDRIFQIGNGFAPQSTSNAFTVLRNGNIGIGKGAIAPTFPLDVDGRIRIRQVGNTTAGIHLDNSQNAVSGFVGMLSDEQLGFYVGNSWKFWVDEAGKGFMRGKLGVGTEIFEPDYTLDLAGRARIRHSTNATAGIYLNDSQNALSGFMGMLSDKQIGFYVANAWRFWVGGDGKGFLHNRLGIGTNVFEPEFTLDIGGRARIRHIANATAGIFFNDSQNSATGFVGMMNDEKIGFYIGNKWRFQVKDNGNVAIGEDVIDPTHLLDVGGRVRIRHRQNITSGIHFDNSLNNLAGFVGMFTDSQLGFYVGNSWRFWIDNGGNGFLKGRLGLGQDIFQPEYPLDVDGRMRIRHKPGRTAGIYFDGAKWLVDEVGVIDTAATIQMDKYGQQLQFKFVSGSVLNPVDVISFKVSAVQAWTKQLTVEGVVEAAGYINQSDRNLKRDLSFLSESLSKVNKLKGYHYYWKDQKDQKLQTGLIAQEVEEIFPELVHTNDQGLKSVNYIGLIPHLLESIKTLKAKNQELDQINASLGDRLTTLEKWVKNSLSYGSGSEQKLGK